MKQKSIHLKLITSLPNSILIYVHNEKNCKLTVQPKQNNKKIILIHLNKIPEIPNFNTGSCEMFLLQQYIVYKLNYSLYVFVT